MMSTAALAGALSLVYAALEMPDSLVAKWLVRPLAAVSIGTVNTSGGLPTQVGSTTTTTTPAPSLVQPTKLGTNLDPGYYYSPNRIFSNLASADGWIVNRAGGGSTDSYFDANRNVIKILAGDQVMRPIMRPTAVFVHKSVDIVCRWDGVGQLYFNRPSSVKNFIQGANTARYTQLYEGENAGWWFVFLITVPDPNNPIRNFDCREANADRTALFDPSYLAHVKKYATVRFMKWQNVEANLPVTWANRTTPAMGQISRAADGYAIEHMIDLANQAHVNPWFCMPWNADDDYVRKFAELVRDRLDPTLTAYVETANEVWNWQYPVTTQAMNEGISEGLSANGTMAFLYRYAEKTGQQMDIWKSVFTGQSSRIVRILASQNGNPWLMTQMLTYGNTATKIDAISTAPYFGMDLNAYSGSTTDLSAIFATLKAQIDNSLTQVATFKQQAAQYHLRYVTYEAGQHVTGNDATLNYNIQHDPRMGQLYNYYLTRWNNEVGDNLVLFIDISNTSTFGAWGMFDYIGQSPNSAPKAKAVSLFQASIGK